MAQNFVANVRLQISRRTFAHRPFDGCSPMTSHRYYLGVPQAHCRSWYLIDRLRKQKRTSLEGPLNGDQRPACMGCSKADHRSFCFGSIVLKNSGWVLTASKASLGLPSQQHQWLTSGRSRPSDAKTRPVSCPSSFSTQLVASRRDDDHNA